MFVVHIQRMLHSSGHVSIVLVIHVPCICFISPQYSGTPLYIASSNGHTDVVRLLLENKADPNISNNVSYSPFH